MIYSRLLFFLLVLSANCAFSQHLLVNNITISGNKKTKDWVIKRELLVERGKVYPDASKDSLDFIISQSRNRVLNLNLFNKVELSLDTLSQVGDTANVNVVIAVIEKWYVWPIPHIEFSDRNFNVWQNLDFDPQRTNYGLFVDHYNVFGRNHTMKTRLKTGYNDQLGVEYRIPFLSPESNWGLTADVHYNSQNEVWYQTRNDSLQFFRNGENNLIQTRGLRVQFSNRVRPFLHFFVGAGYEHNRLDDAVPNENFFVKKGDVQRHGRLFLRLEHDTRDNIYFPLKGVFVSPEVSFHRFANQSFANNAQFNIKAQYFRQWRPKVYSALGLGGEFNSSDSLGYLNSKQIGYDRIIRGFEHYVIEGTWSSTATAALRFHILDKSDLRLNFIPIENYKLLPFNAYLEFYCDMGYVNGNFTETNVLPNTFVYSGGVGLNMLFYNDRLFRLEYSHNSLDDGGIFVHFNKAF